MNDNTKTIILILTNILRIAGRLITCRGDMRDNKQELIKFFHKLQKYNLDPHVIENMGRHIHYGEPIDWLDITRKDVPAIMLRLAKGG